MTVRIARDKLNAQSLIVFLGNDVHRLVHVPLKDQRVDTRKPTCIWYTIIILNVNDVDNVVTPLTDHDGDLHHSGHSVKLLTGIHIGVLIKLNHTWPLNRQSEIGVHTARMEYKKRRRKDDDKENQPSLSKVLSEFCQGSVQQSHLSSQFAFQCSSFEVFKMGFKWGMTGSQSSSFEPQFAN